MYRRYRKRIIGPFKKSEANISCATYADILKDFNTELAKVLILKSFDFKMPYKLGKLRIKRHHVKIELDKNGDIDKKRMAINWENTLELWSKQYPNMTKKELKKIPNKQLIYHLNKHTECNIFSVYWNKIKSNISNINLYSFTFTFTNRRYLAQILKTEPKIIYYE